MKKEIISISLPNSRDAALELFDKAKIKSLPVLKNEELVGIVTQNHLILNPTEDQLALLMTRDPLTITANDDIKKGIEILIEKDLRRLPVVNKKKLVGIFTIEDVIEAIMKLKIKDPIKPYITDVFTTVWEGTPLSVVPGILRFANTQTLPVLNEKCELSGIISFSDLIGESEVITENSKSVSGGTSQDWDWNAASTFLISQHTLKLADKAVNEVMTKDVISTIESKAISDCASIMKKKNINSLIVLDPKDQHLVGMIHDRELMRVLLI